MQVNVSVVRAQGWIAQSKGSHFPRKHYRACPDALYDGINRDIRMRTHVVLNRSTAKRQIRSPSHVLVTGGLFWRRIF